jgi:uncharacterized RDD family membrane protein YckC
MPDAKMTMERDASAQILPAEDSTGGARLAAHERAAQLFEEKRRQKRQIVTPEGVPVTVEIADYGERLAAFVIDFVIWTLLTLAIYIPVLAVVGRKGGSLIAISIALFFGFLIRNLYFIYFELAWQGATPGKRIMGLRVIDRNGGPLLASSVIARNLTREVEMFIPLGILMAGSQSANGVMDWSSLFIAVWLLFFAALPVINHDRMRGGDLIAGTMLISMPRRALLSDLVEGAMQFTFAPQQLQAYGAFELQVLEELLRRPHQADSMQVLDEVCDKICRKIGWTEPVPRRDVVAFLHDFYAAERAYLEREQLYGKTKPDKYTQPAASP